MNLRGDKGVVPHTPMPLWCGLYNHHFLYFHDSVNITFSEVQDRVMVCIRINKWMYCNSLRFTFLHTTLYYE